MPVFAPAQQLHPVVPIGSDRNILLAIARSTQGSMSWRGGPVLQGTQALSVCKCGGK